MTARAQLAALLDALGADELRVITTLVARVGAGRATYGPLALDTDPRAFDREALEEVTDALFYVGVLLTRGTAPMPAPGSKLAFTDRDAALLARLRRVRAGRALLESVVPLARTSVPLDLVELDRLINALAATMPPAVGEA
jgi:hypothetical protein